MNDVNKKSTVSNVRPGEAPVSSGLSLDDILRASRPRIEAPDDLRGDIMRQVRATSDAVARPRDERSYSIWHWMVGPAAAAVGIVALITSSEPERKGQSTEEAALITASQVLGAQERIPDKVNLAMLAPLQKELDGIDADVRRVAEHLLASVP